MLPAMFESEMKRRITFSNLQSVCLSLGVSSSFNFEQQPFPIAAVRRVFRQCCSLCGTVQRSIGNMDWIKQQYATDVLGGGAYWWSKSWNGRELHVLASKMCETNHRRNLLLVSGSTKRKPKENHADARDGATLMWRGRYASTYQAECAHSFTTVYTLVHTSMHEPIRSMKMHKAISTISPATLAVGI